MSKQPMPIRLLLLTAICLGAAAFAADTPDGIPAGYKLLYSQSFDNVAALKDFEATDPKAWQFAREGASSAMQLTRQSQYKPPFRSPVNIALIAGKLFGDFVLEVDMKQTGREYGHRDMCLFFGFEDPARFYYAHLATAADPNAHNIFIVNEAARKNFASKTTQGVNWGLDVWHKVRLVRDTAAGTIRVYFDDLAAPIMEAEDRSFIQGQIGFGSFDDTGMIDNVRIWGPSMKEKPGASFQKIGPG
ncbi:MAG: hypothetical protein KA118_13460 [Verrucomicrobia bacterium]|nr:hypothetical protein [Verrucomicrobiota bacterium]